MDATVESGLTVTGNPDGTTGIPRRYAGQGGLQDHPSTYTTLLPADDEWSRDTVLRAIVADALQRNGLVVDEDTLEATIASFGGSGGALAGTAPAWKLHPGETRADGRVAPPFHGYAVDMPAELQVSLADYARQWSARREGQPEAPVDGALVELKGLARKHDHHEVVTTLEAIQAAIETGTVAHQGGKPLDAVAMAAVLEFATRTGREREAARILERYAAIKHVADEARNLGANAGRVFNGRDPLTGKALDTDQRVDAAFGLLDGGFKLAGSAGNVALMMGARNAGLVGALVGVAPVGIAIVAFAAGAYQLIKHAREALLAPRWDEFRERFPFAVGMEPKHAISGVMRQIAGMPTDAANALSTATRVLEGLGQNPETRERFLAFLKQKVDPDSLIDALASGRGLDRLKPEQAMQLAQAAKGLSKDFLDLELKDVKRYLRDHDGERERGAYLGSTAVKEAANRNDGRVGGALEEGLRTATILSSGAHALNGLYKELLGKVQETPGASKLDAQQQKNLAAALVPLAREGGMSGVDHLFLSRDGSKVFAVQGDPKSPASQMVSLELASGSRQSLETSSQLAARHTADASSPAQAAQTSPGGRGF
ncbi:MAG: XVIPCD domain-containing protein [Pseudoxanthomonas sp.]